MATKKTTPKVSNRVKFTGYLAEVAKSIPKTKVDNTGKVAKLVMEKRGDKFFFGYENANGFVGQIHADMEIGFKNFAGTVKKYK